ncbi:hypothetical protein HY251_03685 [bacterium]|nr:hypothetical protein [bacterium]
MIGALASSLERPFAIAWKDLLVLGKAANGWRAGIGTAILLAPLLGFAAFLVYVPGPWRFSGNVVVLAVAAFFSAFGFTVAMPAATALALERDRDTLASLVVSPARPHELILGKLLAVLGNGIALKAIALPALALAYAFGGREAGFIPRYLLVLAATDLSFASFALMVSAKPLRQQRVGAVNLKLGVTQAQLALQRSVGLAVFSSIFTVYGALFIVPLSLQYGKPIGREVEMVSAAAAVHPLFALVAWGDSPIFGRGVPVWILSCVFHVLLSCPFIAAAAEAQRPPGAPRGRAPRIAFAVFFLYIVLVATGAVWERPAEVKALVGTAVATVLLVFTAMQASTAPPPRKPFGRREVLASLVDPRRALESSAESAPGYLFLLVLLAAPFFFLVAPPLAAAKACAALLLVVLGMSALGARLAARALAKDAAAFERALTKGPATDKAAETRSEEEQGAEPPSVANRVFALLVLFLLAAPLVAALGEKLAAGYPQLEPIRPALAAIGAVGIAANPATALVPIVEAGPFGSQLSLALSAFVRAEPGLLYAIHVALWSLVLAVSIGTLGRAKDVSVLEERALA